MKPEKKPNYDLTRHYEPNEERASTALHKIYTLVLRRATEASMDLEDEHTLDVLSRIHQRAIELAQEPEQVVENEELTSGR